jgi:hypothetical protein
MGRTVRKTKGKGEFSSMETIMQYSEFIKNKQYKAIDSGFSAKTVNPILFDFQRDCVKWALKKGRACLFQDCGLGKTLQQLEWAKHVVRHTNKKVLIVAPLAVAAQTIREGKKIGVDVEYNRDGTAKSPITITNYEMLHMFDASKFAGVVLDESSILKHFTSKTRNLIIDKFRDTPYKLACSATPAPNDLMELGNHSEFMGVMSRTEMLSMFFVHDGGETQKWRLKGHAKEDFWKWLCSWSVMIRKPSDLGYDDNGFTLPSLNYHNICVECGTPLEGQLFVDNVSTLRDRQQARKSSTNDRCKAAANMINATDETWLVWCDRNDESAMLTKMIDGGVEIKGSDKREYKENTMMGFSDRKIKRLITKPSIAGHGMNWQHCNKVCFVGLSDSYEQFYQAVRRSWRFGQTKQVDCYIVTSDTEGSVLKNIQRKEAQSDSMSAGMIQHMQVYELENVRGTQRSVSHYLPQDNMVIPRWLGANQ